MIIEISISIRSWASFSGQLQSSSPMLVLMALPATYYFAARGDKGSAPPLLVRAILPLACLGRRGSAVLGIIGNGVAQVLQVHPAERRRSLRSSRRKRVGRPGQGRQSWLVLHLFYGESA